MSNLVDHIEESILDRGLFRRGQSILVAVSGGLDSMVLLHVLQQLSSKNKWRLRVAHFNHQLRGRSSDADERLVRQTATDLKLPIAVERGSVKMFATKQGLSVEMAARELRHGFLARTARRRKISTVALAHHADDQVEQFFLRVLRGAGGEGLAGMKWIGASPVNPVVKLVRPLLDLDRAALALFAKEQGIIFREDASNRSIQFQRNRIRHELIPLLRKNYQSALSKTTLRLMDIVGEEAGFVTQSARAWLTSHLPTHSPSQLRPLKRGKGEKEKGGMMLGSTLNFLDLPVAIQRRVVQLQMLALGVVADFDLTEQLRESVDQAVAINPQVSVYRDKSGRLHLRKIEAIGFNGEESTLDLAERQGTFGFDRLNIRWRIEPHPRGRPPKAKAGCEYFDASKVGSAVVLRHWRPGDRFRPIGMTSSVKLHDLFTNLKIPRQERHRLVVAVGKCEEVFWVEGVRISELFKLDKETIHRLKWEWQRL